MRLVARSENSAEFRDGFCRLGAGPRSTWGRFLDLAPATEAEFWVAFDGNLPVGRVGANRFSGSSAIGAVGFFEAPDEKTAGLLLNAAESWLKGKGVKRVVGPVSLSAWFGYSFRVDAHETSFAWEPSNPRQYPEYFAKHGYVAAETYRSPAAQGLATYAEGVYDTVKRLSGEFFRFRPFDSANFLAKEVPLLHAISHACVKDSLLFEPISLEFFREVFAPSVGKDHRYSHFVLNREGKEIGFFHAFADQGYLVFKSICIHPEYQGRGLSTALSALSAIKGVEDGIGHFVTGLVKTGNRSESYAKKSTALWQHEYVLYQKMVA